MGICYFQYYGKVYRADTDFGTWNVSEASEVEARSKGYKIQPSATEATEHAGDLLLPQLPKLLQRFVEQEHLAPKLTPPRATGVVFGDAHIASYPSATASSQGVWANRIMQAFRDPGRINASQLDPVLRAFAHATNEQARLACADVLDPTWRPTDPDLLKGYAAHLNRKGDPLSRVFLGLYEEKYPGRHADWDASVYEWATNAGNRMENKLAGQLLAATDPATRLTAYLNFFDVRLRAFQFDRDFELTPSFIYGRARDTFTGPDFPKNFALALARRMGMV